MSTSRLPLLIGLTGRAGAGKDACARPLLHRFTRVAFADPLKAAAKALFDFSDAQLADPELKERVDERWHFTPRRALQVLGTDVLRTHLGAAIGLPRGESLFVHLARTRVNALRASGAAVVVTDVRFDDEAQMIIDLGGFIVRVSRPAAPAAPPSDSYTTHVSERGISIAPHVDIVNDGTLPQLYDAFAAAVHHVSFRGASDVSRPPRAPLRVCARHFDVTDDDHPD